MGHLDHGARSIGLRLAAALVLIVALTSLVSVAPAAAQGDETLVIDMNELNDSGVSGTATLEPDGDVTVVSLDLEGATGDHPAHVHEGTCDDLDPNPAYPLTDVNDEGVSETSIDVPLATLLESPHAVNVHRSTEDIGTYVSCGNITADEDEGAGGEADATAEATSEEESAAEGEAEGDGGNADAADATAAADAEGGDDQTAVGGGADAGGDQAAASDEGGENGGEAAADEGDDDAGGAQAEGGTGGGRATGGTSGTTKTPATGVGSGLTSDGAGLALVVGVGALAVALATGGLVLRRREVRQTAQGRRR